ncbi:MAG: hypothetical protein ACOY5C_09315 [Pseudomonadota bacterium]
MDKQSQIRRVIAAALLGRLGEVETLTLLQHWMDHYAAGAEAKLTFALLDFLRVGVGTRFGAEERRRIYQEMVAGLAKPLAELGPDLWAERGPSAQPALMDAVSDELLAVRRQMMGVAAQPQAARPTAPLPRPAASVAPAPAQPAPAAAVPQPPQPPAAAPKRQAQAAAASAAQRDAQEPAAPAAKPAKTGKAGKGDALYGLDEAVFRDIFLNHD